MGPFQIQVVLIHFFTYIFYGNKSNIFNVFGRYEIFLAYSSLFQDFAKLRSHMFVIFTLFPSPNLHSPFTAHIVVSSVETT